MNYLIAGFSGAGKSHLLTELKKERELSDFSFFDLDSLIEKNLSLEKDSLGEWIREKGMQAFRLQEEEAILTIFKNENRCIVALGGGSLTLSVLKMLENYPHKIFYLDTPFEVCFERIKEDKNRPLADLGLEKLEELYRERKAQVHELHPIKEKQELISYILSQSLAAKNSK